MAPITARIMLSLSFLLLTALAQTHSGTLFFFEPGLGACGFTNTSTQLVGGVSSTFFQAVGGGVQSDENPLCGQQMLVAANGKSVVVEIVDSLDALGPLDIGVSPVAFEVFAPLDQGVVLGVLWTTL